MKSAIVLFCVALFHTYNAYSIAAVSEDPASFTISQSQSHSRTLLVSTSTGSSGPSGAAAITGDSSGLNLAPTWPAASETGDATFNRSSSLEDYMTAAYAANPKNYLFLFTRIMANGTGLVPFTENNRQLLWSSIFAVGDVNKLESIAIASTTDASPIMEGVPYVRPAIVSADYASNHVNVVISDNILIMAIAQYFSPPTPLYSSSSFQYTDSVIMQPRLKAAIGGGDWVAATTSGAVFGPPQFKNIVAKVQLSSPNGTDLSGTDYLAGYVNPIAASLADSLQGAMASQVSKVYLVDVIYPTSRRRSLLHSKEGRGSGRRLFQTAPTSMALANVKLVFFFYKNITAAPRRLIEEGLKQPSFVRKLVETGFTATVPVVYTADTFPFYEGISVPMTDSVAPLGTPGGIINNTSTGASINGGVIAGSTIAAAAFLLGLVVLTIVWASRRKEARLAILGQPNGGDEILVEQDKFSPTRELEAVGSVELGAYSGTTTFEEKQTVPDSPRSLASTSTSMDGQLAGFADVQIDPTAITFPRTPLGMFCVIGKGAFGQVVLGRYAEHHVAVKILWEQGEKLQAQFLQEAKILKRCRSPYVVLLLGIAFWTETENMVLALPGSEPTKSSKLMMVMEYMQRRDLWFQIHEGADAAQFKWHLRGRSVAVHIARGLVYLHSNNIVHLDLKSQNILLTEAFQAKLADVGLAKLFQIDSNRSMSTISHFTWQYSAPEVLAAGHGISAKADIFSLGVVLWEICTGENPHKGVPYHIFLVDGIPLRSISVPEEGPEELNALIRECLSVNPDDRPSANQALATLTLLAKSQSPRDRRPP